MNQSPIRNQPTAPVYNHSVGPVVQQPHPTGPGNLRSISGLECLQSLNHLVLQQKIKLWSGCLTQKDEYKIKNNLGQNLFSAIENIDNCACYCALTRAIDIKVFDMHQNEVIRINGEPACSKPSVDVLLPSGNRIGRIEQKTAWCGANNIFVKNHNNETIFMIEVDIWKLLCNSSCRPSYEFSILTPSGDHVGKIVNKWTNWLQESFTDADHFGISFPSNLDVHTKALLLGACFFIDIMLFTKR